MNKVNNDIWLEKINKIFKLFKIVPKNYSTYIKALTHSSYAYENNLNYDYERYEFIGDSAISWIISNFLFSNDTLSEGSMSIKKAKLVSGETLAHAAKMIGLDEVIITGKGLEKISDKILENSFEAFVGAVARDLGIKKAYSIVNYCIIEPYLHGEINVDKPYKTLIQEALMRSYNKEIKYVSVNSQTNLRKVNLVFDGMTYGTGEAPTLRQAEELAAKDAYSRLKIKK